MMKLNMAILGLVGLTVLGAQPRFDMQVRNDFFAGFGGDVAAFDRGMKACEQVLAQNPKHAEALVWHGGGVFYMHSRSVAREFEQQLAAATANANSVRQETDARLAKEMGITPKEIKRLGDSTVFVVNSWQLYDRETNRPIYQKMVRIEHRLLPAYVRLSNNEIVRWLTLEQTKDDIYTSVGDRLARPANETGRAGAMSVTRIERPSPASRRPRQRRRRRSR